MITQDKVKDLFDYRSSKKGVTYRAKRDKWETTYCGKYVGLYPTWEEAVEARYQAEIRDGMNLRTAL